MLPVLTSGDSLPSADCERSEQDQTFVFPFSNPNSLKPKLPLQVTNFKGMSDFGSLLLTLQRITTSFGKGTIRELQHGSLRATY